MIKDGKTFLELPEDWKKIIGVIREGPATLKEITSRTGMTTKRVYSFIFGMEKMAIIEKDGHVYKMRDKK